MKYQAIDFQQITITLAFWRLALFRKELQFEWFIAMFDLHHLLGFFFFPRVNYFHYFTASLR